MTNDTKPNVDYIELVAAILLGVAAMAIAWSTYQASLWGGIQDEAYTESVRAANAAVDQLQAADRIRALDQLIFVEMQISGVCDTGDGGDTEACDGLFATMSDRGRQAVTQASSGSSPFDSSAYVDELYGPGEAERLASDAFFQDAGVANENGDDHELVVTVLTAVLFFAGIAAVMDDRRVGWALIVASGVFMVVGLVYSVTLPLA